MMLQRSQLHDTGKDEWVQSQIDETVRQEAAGTTVRLATITCQCGRSRAVLLMYKCLYCNEWFCHQCAEVHFGKTVSDYRAEHTTEEAC